jgi:hypothetical protein
MVKVFGQEGIERKGKQNCECVKTQHMFPMNLFIQNKKFKD